MKKIAILLLLIKPSLLFAAITIGQGQQLGTDAAGQTFYEEFMDWTHGDLRALDKCGALWDSRYNFSDGYDDSRDLTAFYTRAEGDNYYFRVDFYDLKQGAENGFLDFYIVIDCAPNAGQEWMPDYTDLKASPDHPWDLCICVYSWGTTAGTNYNIYDASWSNSHNAEYLGSHFQSELDSVELGIKKSALTSVGWDGSRTIYFQVFTTKDGTENGAGNIPGHSDAVDAIGDDDRGYTDGILRGVIAGTDKAGRASYASIAHGNQSINRADDVRIHIFDSNTTHKTGFVRALDTHEIFRVPLNIHMSGSLIAAARWAAAPNGASDLSDGPSFIKRVAKIIDPSQTSNPSSLIGGVFAEHIMPYFEGDVNNVSINLFDEIAFANFGLRGQQMKVMHTPERVIRSLPTNLAPLTGMTFADISASPYAATVLDEVTHFHWWFDSAETRWSGQGGSYDAPAHHKIHKINGVYCFLINDREDQAKFGNDDGGLLTDTRYTLLEKAMQADQAQLTLVFDDWEALAGKSFDPGTGNPAENNNQTQYQNTIRWLANHQWVEILNLAEVLERAVNPSHPQYNAAWVIDHGTKLNNLSLQTYEWLKHATEGSYHYWYYNNDGGNQGNEQSFYDLVPVITGKQGDYRWRGETPAQDGAPLPSGKKLGDLNTPGSLLRDSWDALAAAPANDMKRLGEYCYCSMIYETAWHEEDNGDYHSHNYQNWTNPDTTWDGLNTWALRLNNHARKAGVLAEAAQWADAVLKGTQPAQSSSQSKDVDFDGEDEYILKNNRVFACFERYGGRCVFAAAWDAQRQKPIAVIGSPASNPSAPGEEEYGDNSANRCSAFKDMNGGVFADKVYNQTLASNSITFSAGDAIGTIAKTITLPDGAAFLRAAYSETLSGALYVRIGASPNNYDLLLHGRDNLSASKTAEAYTVANSTGGMVQVTLTSGASYNPSPSFGGYQNRNLSLTEEIEIYGESAFVFDIVFAEKSPDKAAGFWLY